MKNLQTPDSSTAQRQCTSCFSCVYFLYSLLPFLPCVISHLWKFFFPPVYCSWYFKCNVWFLKSTVFKNVSFRSERFSSVFYSDVCVCVFLRWQGGVGLLEEVSLMLVWEIHNHWSHCWALIRPAVSSLKGQKSIPLHYRADSVVISTHASSLVQAHMRTHPNNTEQSHLALFMSYGSDVCSFY